jgi:hypothetical protein
MYRPRGTLQRRKPQFIKNRVCKKRQIWMIAYTIVRKKPRFLWVGLRASRGAKHKRGQTVSRPKLLSVKNSSIYYNDPKSFCIAFL